MKQCKQCQKQFEITDADRKTLAHFDVPESVLCPLCKHQRRWSFRNERYLYSRKCAKCQKNIISVYSPEKPYVVYCRDCFLSDSYNPLATGQDFDFSKTFTQQFDALLKSTPLIALTGGTNCENSEYVNLETDDKNCYMNVGGHFNEDCYYNTFCLYGKNCVDNYWVFHSELMYESTDCHKCYKCFFCNELVNCTECWFSFKCKNCTNCFGCVNQQNKSYMFFNKQLTKEDYFKEIQKFVGSAKGLEEIKKRFEEEKLKYPHKFAFQMNCVDSTGEYLNDCKNAVNAFDTSKAEDCRNVVINEDIKDVVDSSHIGWGELTYDSMGGMQFNNTAFSCFCFPGLTFSRYCMFVMNSENCFGCVSLKKNSYCILNKQYTKEEYNALVPRIIAHMRKIGEWGEFFNPAISPFGYNESVANLYFPLEKVEAIKKGFNWFDNTPNTVGKETVDSKNIPDKIIEADDAIIKEIFACANCAKNYKVVKQELVFYKQNELPLPRKCPYCRYEGRMKKRGISFTLYKRSCMCDLAGHESLHAGGAKCQNEFETTYAPDRLEKIFCEGCYQKEVI